MGKCVCHIDSTRPDWGINTAHMWDSPNHTHTHILTYTHTQAHTPSQQQNPQLDLRASFCLSYCPLIPSVWTPISSRRGFMTGRTSSLQHNTISIGLSTALFQTRHPLNQGITVIQLSDNSISFYLPLSLSFRLNISESDVINIDSAIVRRHFISMYIRFKCLTAKTLYISIEKKAAWFMIRFGSCLDLVLNSIK